MRPPLRYSSTTKLCLPACQSRLVHLKPASQAPSLPPQCAFQSGNRKACIAAALPACTVAEPADVRNLPVHGPALLSLPHQDPALSAVPHTCQEGVSITVSSCADLQMGLTFPMLSMPRIYSSNQASPANAAANGIATEALAAVRTVLSFNGEQRTLERYRASLQKPMQTGLPALPSFAFSSHCQPAAMGCLRLLLPPHPADCAVYRLIAGLATP